MKKKSKIGIVMMALLMLLNSSVVFAGEVGNGKDSILFSKHYIKGRKYEKMTDGIINTAPYNRAYITVEVMYDSDGKVASSYKKSRWFITKSSGAAVDEFVVTKQERKQFYAGENGDASQRYYIYVKGNSEDKDAMITGNIRYMQKVE